MGTIYRKTEKGQVEIETRALRLAPRLRTALILVDGRRTDNDLRPLVPGDVAQTFQTLLQDGFIEVVRVVEERAVPRPPAPPGSNEPARRLLEQRRRDAVRSLIDQVGPLGEAVAVRLEKCTDWSELKPTLELARQVLEYARGSSAAQDYARKYIEVAPDAT
jgi:hypothetical protein